MNLQSLDRPHPILGNGQHVGVAAVVLAAALFSVEFFQEVTPIGLAISSTHSMRQQAGCSRCACCRCLMLDSLSACHVPFFIAELTPNSSASSCVQVQDEFRELTVADDHVIYKAGSIKRIVYANRDGMTLRDAAISMTEYSRPIQDLIISLLSCSKPDSQNISEIYKSFICTHVYKC